MMDELSILPVELLERICHYLPAVTRVSLSKTCSRLRAAIHKIEGNKPELKIFLNLGYLGLQEDEDEYIPNFVCSGPVLEGTTYQTPFEDFDAKEVFDYCENLFDRNCNMKSFSVRVFGTGGTGNDWREKLNDLHAFRLPYAKINDRIRSFLTMASNSAMFIPKMNIFLNIAMVDYTSFGIPSKGPYFRRCNEVNTFFADCPPAAHYHIGICGEEAFKFITTNPSRLQDITVEVQIDVYPVSINIEMLRKFVEDCLSGEFSTDYGTGREPTLPQRTRIIACGFEDDFLICHEIFVELAQKEKYKVSWRPAIRCMEILIEKKDEAQASFDEKPVVII